MNGEKVVGLYRTMQARATTLLFKSSFHGFGKGSTLYPPAGLYGADRMRVGSNTHIGAGMWMQVILEADEEYHRDVMLEIGNDVIISGNAVLSIAHHVVIGDSVGIARGAYIGDHGHMIDQPSLPIRDQGITVPRPVVIKEGAMIGENAFICPGVRVGKRAAVGSNSVVTKDVEPYTVVAGAPARVIRKLEHTD